MIISNAKIYIDGAFTEGGIDFDERINEVGKGITGGTSASGCYIIPGLVDIHTHGALGYDVSDGTGDDIYRLGEYYAKGGVTSWCPTTMTLKEEALTSAVKTIAAYKRPDGGARIAGIHLEGPFLSMAKKGAQNAENLHLPDWNMFMRIYDASEGLVKLVTVAPEEEGAMEFIERASKLAAVSIGHTAADYDTAMRAFEAGASHATHLFNGMPGIHHRSPGVIPAALDSGASIELIADGLHIHPSVIRMTYKMFGEKLCLISDSLRCAGMPDGDYELGGQPITMKDGKACLSGSDTLAGSSIHLMEGLRRAAGFGIPLEQAIYAATLAPARSIGMDKEIGSLAKGKYSDFVILDEGLKVKSVYVNGAEI